MVTDNLAVTLGIFNGAMGTVHSFGFMSDDAPVSQPTLADVAGDEGYNQPVVFVRMDRFDGESVSSKVEHLVPIVAQHSRRPMKLNKQCSGVLPLAAAFEGRLLLHVPQGARLHGQRRRCAASSS